MKRKVLIEREQKKLDDLFLQADSVEEEIQAHLGRYLCVLSSGHLENSVKYLIEEYMHKKCPPQINDFVVDKLKNTTNLDYQKLCKFLKVFSVDWEANFSKQVTEEDQEILNTIIANRNLISHGRVSNISYGAVKKNFSYVKKIVNALEKTIKK